MQVLSLNSDFFSQLRILTLLVATLQFGQFSLNSEFISHNCVFVFVCLVVVLHVIKSKQDDVVQCSLFLRIASLYLCFLHLYHAAFTSCNSEFFFFFNSDFISNNSSQFCVHVFYINLYPTILMQNCKKMEKKSQLSFVFYLLTETSYRHFTF